MRVDLRTTDYGLQTTDWRRRRPGFTLIEFLVVVGILLLAVGSTLAFLTSVLKGSNQANVTAEVKQNGQAVLDSLDSQIRNAIGVECKDSGGSPIDCTSAPVPNKYLKLLRFNSDPLHIKCFSDGAPPKGENGWIGTVVSTGNPWNSTSGYLSLTNLETVSGVDIQDCDFKVLPASSGIASPATVSVSFLVNQGINAPSRQDFLANVQFQTTISLRQY